MCVVIAAVLLALMLCQSVFQIRVLLATTDNVSQLEQQRDEEKQRATQQAEERGNITMAGHGNFDLMDVYELMDVKEKWVNRRAVYKKAGDDVYLYFPKSGMWMIGPKECLDKGSGGWMKAPASAAFTPDNVPADTAWEAYANTGWVELPQVRARRN